MKKMVWNCLLYWWAFTSLFEIGATKLFSNTLWFLCRYCHTIINAWLLASKNIDLSHKFRTCLIHELCHFLIIFSCFRFNQFLLKLFHIIFHCILILKFKNIFNIFLTMKLKTFLVLFRFFNLTIFHIIMFGLIRIFDNKFWIIIRYRCISPISK